MTIDEQINYLTERSVDFFSQEALRKKLERAEKENTSLRIKYGADPSAPDIHLGHVVGLNKLREFQECGHTVIFIIGDFTGMIGDPSGRSQTRKPLTKKEVQSNAASYQEQVFKVLDKDKTEIRFNSEWCSKLVFEDIIRLSSHVTVAQMLARDDFAKRHASNEPISMVEFLYPLVQAYDSVVVEADIELGGTDQLFNLLLGREFQKALGQEQQCVMTLPLIEGLDGTQKMSKSLNNYVALDDHANDMYGKLMSIPDQLMWKYYRYIVCRPEVEVEKMKQEVSDGILHPRVVKDQLAKAIVGRFKGDVEADEASAEFTRIFKEKALPNEMPEVIIDAGDIGLLSLMVHAGLAKSNGDARRLIKQGAVRVNDQRVDDERMILSPENGMILKSGKRGFAKIIIN